MKVAYNSSEKKMPVIFVGMAVPLNAIENNEFSRAWAEIGNSMPPVGRHCLHFCALGTDGTFCNGDENS